MTSVSVSLTSPAQKPVPVGPHLDMAKYICPTVMARTTNLSGQKLAEQIIANLHEILLVNVCRLAYAYHHFAWIDNNTIYVAYLEDSLELVRFTAKNIDMMRKRFQECDDTVKAEALAKIFYKRMAKENAERKVVGVKMCWQDEVYKHFVEIGASFQSLTNWMVKMQYTTKWNDDFGLHRFDAISGIALS